MDEALEADLLRIVDHALACPPTADTFRHFSRAFLDRDKEGSDKATAHVKHLLRGRDLLDFPPEYVAALDEMLPRERSGEFIDLGEYIGWTVCDEFELTEQDRTDGYRSLDEFFEFLKMWRAPERVRSIRASDRSAIDGQARP